MRFRKDLVFGCWGFALLLAASTCPAQEVPCEVDHFRRAGNPQEIAPWARPSNGPGWIGYFVGGGALSRHCGDQPGAEDGTWGWDYRGCLLPRRVNLFWLHGRRKQGGVGAYKTDGPALPHLREKEGHGAHPE